MFARTTACIAFLTATTAAAQVYSAKLTGNSLTKITDPPGRVVKISVSRGSSKVLLSVVVAGKGQLLLMNPDGTGLQSVGTDEPIEDRWAGALTPDGMHILYSASDGSSFNLYKVDLNGANRILIKKDAIFGRFSPDSTHIIFTRILVRGESGVFICNPDGTGETRLQTPSDILPLRPLFDPEASTDVWFTSSSLIKRVHLDGSVVQAIDTRGRLFDGVDVNADDSAIVYSKSVVTPPKFDIFNSKPDGTATRQITSDPNRAFVEPVFSPDGHAILFYETNPAAAQQRQSLREVFAPGTLAR
jgi:Tol biopolymer transport system component